MLKKQVVSTLYLKVLAFFLILTKQNSKLNGITFRKNRLDNRRF